MKIKDEAVEAFTKYRRKQITELRPYQNGEDMTGVSISAEDYKRGSPKPGDMIARNPKNHADQWLVAAAYFAENFEPLTALPHLSQGAAKDGPEVVERLRKWCSETINQWSDEYEPRENWERQVSVAMREWSKATDDATRIITACQQEVGRLREFERQHDYCCCGSRMEDHDIGSGHSPVSVYDYQYDRAVTRAEAAEARNAELVKALEEIASDDERGDYEGVVQFARAALGGQSNEA